MRPKIRPPRTSPRCNSPGRRGPMTCCGRLIRRGLRMPALVPGRLGELSRQPNGIDNVRYRRGKVEDIVPKIDEPVDVLVLDPPRAGCAEAAVEAMGNLRPERIVYISCEPSTLARDVSRFSTGGRYTLAEVAFVDMFPQTYHIEAVAKLQRTA